MDCFYIITNKLKDKDYAITSQIEQYIQSSGKKCFLSEKDSEGHIIPGTVPKEAECGLVLGGDPSARPPGGSDARQAQAQGEGRCHGGFQGRAAGRTGVHHSH